MNDVLINIELIYFSNLVQFIFDSLMKMSQIVQSLNYQLYCQFEQA